MKEYTAFTDYLLHREDDEWVALSEIQRRFPGIDQKVIDRMTFNHRLELKEFPEKGFCIRLTLKGREKLQKKKAPVKESVVGTAIIIIIVIIFKLLR